MTGAFNKLLHSRTGLAQFARYAVIGSTVFCIDVGSFLVFIRLHVGLLEAVTMAYILGIVAHFVLNKFWNFRAFDRSTRRQAGTYLVLAGIQYFTTLAMVTAAVKLANVQPLEARILAALVNVPLSFLAHKYLTFGRGIVSALRGIRR